MAIASVGSNPIPATTFSGSIKVTSVVWSHAIARFNPEARYHLKGKIVKCPCKNCITLAICQERNITDIIWNCSNIREYLTCNFYGYIKTDSKSVTELKLEHISVYLPKLDLEG
ncbi:MAG: hypothetical protein ACFFG0_00515 [Candidatus Thorarchaeota archaeon]